MRFNVQSVKVLSNSQQLVSDLIQSFQDLSASSSRYASLRSLLLSRSSSKSNINKTKVQAFTKELVPKCPSPSLIQAKQNEQATGVSKLFFKPSNGCNCGESKKKHYHTQNYDQTILLNTNDAYMHAYLHENIEIHLFDYAYARSFSRVLAEVWNWIMLGKKDWCIGFCFVEASFSLLRRNKFAHTIVG